MITISYGKMNNQNFIAATRALAASKSILSVQSMMTVITLINALEIELRKLSTATDMLLEQYGSKIDGEPGKYKIEDDKKDEFASKINELHAVTFTIDRDKIPFSDLQTYGLSAVDFILLDDIIDLSEAHQFAKKPSLSPVS